MKDREQFPRRRDTATAAPPRVDHRHDELSDDDLDRVAGGLERAWLERGGPAVTEPPSR